MFDTFKALLVEFVGSYTPTMTDVYDEAGNIIGQTVASGFAGIDWPWVFGASLILLCIWIFGRVLYGAIFGRR